MPKIVEEQTQYRKYSKAPKYSPGKSPETILSDYRIDPLVDIKVCYQEN